MARKDDNTVMIEGARLVFRNFAGKEGKYNREGDRNFGVLLDEPIAQQMAKDEWNVKWLKAKEEGEPDQAYINVTVNFRGKPPRINMISSRGRTPIGEDEVEMLDWVDVKNCDIIIRPYAWAVRDATGVKAYLQSMFITIEEDALELKYADIQDVRSRSGATDE